MAAEPLTLYRLELDESVLEHEKYPYVKFWALGEKGRGVPTRVVLDADSRVFETTSRRDYERLRGTAGLVDGGEVGVLDPGELPAREIIAAIGSYDAADLEALSSDDRVTVRDAAAAELERRAESEGGE